MGDSTIELLKWILTALLGTGWIGTFMFYNTKKRKVRLEADKDEFQLDMAQVEHLKKQNKEAYDTIEKLQTIINELREKNIKDGKKIIDLEFKALEADKRQKIAEYNMCMVENCYNRVPKRDVDFCKNKSDEHE